MRTIVIGWRDKEEPYCCSHEGCYPDFPFQTPWPLIEHPAKYEIACPCGDSHYLCEKHGQWEATPPLKKRKYSPRILALFGTDGGVEVVNLGSGNSLFNKIKNM